MTTWSSTDKSSTIALSNGNLTALSATAVAQGVRSTTSKSSGKWFFEITLDAPTFDYGIGIATSAYALTDPNQIGGSPAPSNTSVGFYPFFQMGIYTLGNRLSGGNLADFTNEVVSFAVDFTARKLWITSTQMRAEGHAWNNDVLANQNPATGVGGVDLSVLVSGSYFIIFVDDIGGAQATLNVAGNFNQPVPSGYSAWDLPAPTPTPTPVPTPAVTQAFDPAHNNANNTLSNSNLTATHAGSNTANTLCILSETTGQWYWEVHPTGTGPWRVGIANVSASTADGATLASITNGFSWNNSGVVTTNGVQQGTVATYVSGNTLGIALDLVNGKIWFRVGTGGWNNDVLANQNPALNIGGFVLPSAVTTGGCVPAITLQTAGDQVTMTFAQSGWQGTAPSNFSAFNPAAPTPTPTPTPVPSPVPPTPVPTPGPPSTAVPLPSVSVSSMARQVNVSTSTSSSFALRQAVAQARTGTVLVSGTATATGLIFVSHVGSAYRYDVTINNIGSTTIGTFWFAWDDAPEQNFMTVIPTNVTAPSGWTYAITYGGAGDGYGIEFTTPTPVAPNTTISGFGFTSTMTPTQMFSASAIDPTFQTTSSFVYISTAFADSGYQFVLPQFVAAPTPTPVPTPPPVPTPSPSLPTAPISNSTFTAWWQAMCNELIANKDLLFGFIIDSGDPQGLTGEPDSGVINTDAAQIIGSAFRTLQPVVPAPTPAPVPVPGPPPPVPPPTPPPTPTPVPVPVPVPTPRPPTPTPVPVPTPSGESPQGSMLTSTSGQIRDAQGNLWTLVQGTGLEVFENGAAAGFSQNVILLLYWNHTIYQENSDGGWWFWDGVTPWVGTSDPRTAPTPGPPPVPSPPPGPTPPPGPPPAGNTIQVNLGTASPASNGVTFISPYLFGAGTEGLCDVGVNNYCAAVNPGWQNTYRQQNWRLFRVNCEGTANDWVTPGSQVRQNFQNGFSTFWQNENPVSAKFSKNRLVFTVGSADLFPYGPSECVTIANWFRSIGMECFYWEIWNEPDAAMGGTWESNFAACRSALKQVNPNYLVGGPVNTFPATSTFNDAAGVNADFASFHWYLHGSPGSVNGASLYSQALSNGSNHIGIVQSSNFGSNTPIFLGEWSITWQSGGDPNDQTIDGALFINNYLYGAMTHPNSKVEMSAIWTIGQNTQFTFVNNDGSNVRPRGYLLGKLGTIAGPRVQCLQGSNLNNILSMAMFDGSRWAVWLTNYNSSGSVPVNLQGLTGSNCTYWELSPSHTVPLTQTISVSSLSNLSLPSRSVVVITNF